VKALELAILFHDTYERLAPSFGYETRPDTRQFDAASKNGRLMVAVCGEVLQRLGLGAKCEYCGIPEPLPEGAAHFSSCPKSPHCDPEDAAQAEADARFISLMQASSVPLLALDVYESNSWRRVGLRDRYHEVMAPCTQKDGHPDIRGTDVLRALVAAFNAMLLRHPLGKLPSRPTTGA
jgi:hypothetical protein